MGRPTAGAGRAELGLGLGRVPAFVGAATGASTGA